MLTMLAVLFPAVAGVYVALKKFPEGKKRNDAYTLVVMLTDFFGILAIAFSRPLTLFVFSKNVTFLFAFDGVGRFAAAAVLILYTAVTFYAYEYMTMEEEVDSFFAFYFLSMGAMIAVCASGNLVTLYLCFELATLTSVPLVLHEKTEESIKAAVKYLFYSIAGALLGLLGVFFTYYYGSGERAFVLGGFLDRTALAGHEGAFLFAIFAALIGFGTKAGMYPMHGWLPAAHPIAPAPASALLSGVIAKAGIVAVIRLIYFSVGVDALRGTWVQTLWMCLAMLTIFMGSMMAFKEKILKKRLAYSTVSQISYIMLALSTLSLDGLRGGLVHMMAHASAKGTLFLVAGIFIYKLGVRDVDSLKGIGRQMPVTMWCFLIAGLSLVGIPPLGGFTSKWLIAGAAIGNAPGGFAIAAPVMLLISALLTAGYLLPIVIDAFFPGKDFDGSALEPAEPTRLMTIPMICLCTVSLLVGVFGGSIVEVLF
ncbi:MAG: proton-conducting membrane transporter [Blautia sp.]|nr:proton-conducting membrane transporter [Blautia sp.]